jgi:hypothetical protein
LGRARQQTIALCVEAGEVCVDAAQASADLFGSIHRETLPSAIIACQGWRVCRGGEQCPLDDNSREWRPRRVDAAVGALAGRDVTGGRWYRVRRVPPVVRLCATDRRYPPGLFCPGESNRSARQGFRFYFFSREEARPTCTCMPKVRRSSGSSRSTNCTRTTVLKEKQLAEARKLVEEHMDSGIH